MEKIMKLNGVTEEIKEDDFDIYDWTIKGETYFLVYDENGDLYGVTIREFDEDFLYNVISELYKYEFPPTRNEYIDILFDMNY